MKAGLARSLEIVSGILMILWLGFLLGQLSMGTWREIANECTQLAERCVSKAELCCAGAKLCAENARR